MELEVTVGMAGEEGVVNLDRGRPLLLLYTGCRKVRLRGTGSRKYRESGSHVRNASKRALTGTPDIQLSKYALGCHKYTKLRYSAHLIVIAFGYEVVQRIWACEENVLNGNVQPPRP